MNATFCPSGENCGDHSANVDLMIGSGLPPSRKRQMRHLPDSHSDQLLGACVDARGDRGLTGRVYQALAAKMSEEQS